MKKILSFALAIVMLISVLAFSAYADEYETKTVDVKWNFGYVGSSTNSSGFVNVINPTGSNYSYSDVIDMGPAGSTITFTDSASGYASAAAYVFSFWKKNGTEYELDIEAGNIPGGFGGTARDYEFVTTVDNQSIRVTYRSEQTSSFTPAYEEIFVDGVKVDVNWNFGYVKADGTIKESGGYYSYTDVFVVEKAGSKVTFTDSNKNGTNFCSNSAYVFSTWTKDGDNWVCSEGVKGASGTYTDKSAPYSYTSTKDNELIRLCYNSGEKSDAPVADRPVVTLKSPVPAATETTESVPETSEPTPETTVAPEVTEPSVNPGTGDASFAIVVAAVATVVLAAVVIRKRSLN